ncbi:MAG: DinB family protein [Gemmatimonadaceae bacterium]|nr:DinB family protein [Gemmatimonadaceae bacterium]MDQ3520190.1 DinB family protein [Gemmatimonadota bacterium]
MKPDFRAQVAVLEQRRGALLQEVGALPEAQLTFQPMSGAWSIAQIIEHLLLVEGGIVERVTTRPPRAVRIRVRDRLGYAAVWVALSYGLRVKAPIQSVMPQKGITLSDAAEQWRSILQTLLAHLEVMRDEDLSLSVFKHPIGGPMTIAEALLFITRHFDHHLRQIARVRNSPGFPAMAAENVRE